MIPDASCPPLHFHKALVSPLLEGQPLTCDYKIFSLVTVFLSLVLENLLTSDFFELTYEKRSSGSRGLKNSLEFVFFCRGGSLVTIL